MQRIILNWLILSKNGYTNGGYIEETSFEVNMLSANENTILSLNYLKTYMTTLQYKIEPNILPA